MTKLAAILAVGLFATVAMGGAVAPPAGMPEALRGMPPKAREAAAALQQILERQRGLIAQAQQAKTPEERQAVFAAVARNVRTIAQQRVVLMAEHAHQARKRVEWARKHASQVKVSGLVGAAKDLAQRGPPRSPFAEGGDLPEPKPGPLPQELAELPASVAKARAEVERTQAQLARLREKSTTARSDAERATIRREIEQHLKTIETQRVAILEAVLAVSEKRLAWARERAEP